MMNIELVLLSKEHISQLQAYRSQFEGSPNGIEGSSELTYAPTIEQWLEKVERNRHWETVREGWMPAEQFIAVEKDTGEIVGMLNLRKALNEYLLNYIGHIGYSVAPSKRRQGIGAQMLKLALLEGEKLGLEKILVTCTEDNIASIGVIERNGGKYEDTTLDPGDGKWTRRYWFDI